jgi:hypothetical protein
MGAILGGTMRSPFTGVIFALELTHDVNLLVPLLVAVTIVHGFTVLVLRRSILTEKVALPGGGERIGQPPGRDDFPSRSPQSAGVEPRGRTPPRTDHAGRDRVSVSAAPCARDTLIERIQPCRSPQGQ